MLNLGLSFCLVLCNLTTLRKQGGPSDNSASVSREKLPLLSASHLVTKKLIRNFTDFPNFCRTTGNT